MDKILRVNSTVEHKRGAAVVCADQIKSESGLGSVCQRFTILRTVVKVGGKLAPVALNPPLPSRQDVLNNDIRPLRIARKLAVYDIFKTVTSIEIRNKGVAAYNRAFRNILCDALKAAA